MTPDGSDRKSVGWRSRLARPQHSRRIPRQRTQRRLPMVLRDPLYVDPAAARIIQVTSDDLSEFACGKTRSTLTLVYHLRRIGVPVQVVSPPPHPVRPFVRAMCYALAKIDRPTGKVMRHYTYGVPFMWRTLSKTVGDTEALGQPYVVHARDFLSLLAFERVRPSGSLARTVLTMHCPGSTADELITEGYLRKGSRAETLIRRQEARALNSADAVVTASVRGRHELLQIFRGLDPDKVHVIPNPVEIAHALERVTRQEIGIPEDAFLVLVASRLKRIKRLDLLVEAVAIAHRQAPHLRVVIAGEGHSHREISHAISRAGLEDVVTLLGRRADIPDLMEVSDAVALTSERESFGRALAEGAIVGRPLVAFDVGGVNEIVVEDATGYLIPFGDVQGYADALVRLAFEGSTRARLGARAHEHSRHFAPAMVADFYLELFERLCANGGPTR